MQSNRLAPSREIAFAFAHYSRVRHLLSGGRHFFRDTPQSRKYLGGFGPSFANPGNASSDYAGNAGIWRQNPLPGLYIHVLLNQHSSSYCYLGPSVHLNPRFGTCVLDKQTQRSYDCTDMARHFPTSIAPPVLSSPSQSTYFTATSMTLSNGDVCHIGDWVLFKSSLFVGNTEAPALGRVHEIIVDEAGIGTRQYSRPDAILLQQADVTEWAEPYRMPRISVSNNWAAVDITVSCLLSVTRIGTF